MKNRVLMILSTVLILAVGACTVNVYDYSTHSEGSAGSSQPPDTVYVHSDPDHITAPSTEPDTVTTRRALVGGGSVLIEECDNWTRYTLFGCKTETDGVAFEIRPVMTSITGSDGSVTEDFQLEFDCRMQSYILDSDEGESALVGGSRSSSAGRSVMPVVTGTNLVTIVANRTSFPFIAEQARSYDGDWLPDGTLSYSAAFASSEWMVRDICTAEQLVVMSESPEYRMIFGDDERRLLQQFFDIFVLHGGEAPALPVGGGGAADMDSGRI
ncbi:hypothetical protein DRQ21_10410 [Candidatus Fermentibacteria bacterium]|nr:MAG: hypothetical protein DRQ21_10410 [Candidatus Fermentibacteria bacterium]